MTPLNCIGFKSWKRWCRLIAVESREVKDGSSNGTIETSRWDRNLQQEIRYRGHGIFNVAAR